MIGERLSHYTIESRIGEGGMGDVYLARDGKLGRSVAIKLLPDGAIDDPESLERFVREAKAASSLNHPNIVTIHEIGEGQSGPFIVMEHVDGIPLSRAMSEPLPLDRFLDYALQITSALGAAHEAGIVHRDIKPANIMVTSSGRIKVVDFGLARVAPMAGVDQDGATAKMAAPATAQGRILGTVGYMSPEQVQGFRVDPRSDVFTLGIVMHEMLTGRPLFRDASTVAVLSAILRDEPPRVSSLRRDVPKKLADIVARCMAKDPAARQANASEVHRELADLRQIAGPKREPAILAAAAIVLVGVIAAGIWWWRREANERWARNLAIPEIERLAAADDLDGAYRLALRARDILPADPQLQQLWTNITFPVKFESAPPGADVSFKAHAATSAPWISLGKTPTPVTNLPLTLLRFRVTRDGYVPLEVAREVVDETAHFELVKIGEAPARMVRVPAGSTVFADGSVDVPAFWIDQYEVTNREYKRFVDAGGYQRRELWKHPVVRDGRTLAWEVAMQEMVDSTGRPGPSTWELGTYAEGEAELPVNGISWYEAAAYAQFAGKKLPTVYHWWRAAVDFSIFSDVLASSNFAGKNAVAAGSLPSFGPYGTYDMAGNVKEWCANATGDKRFILGGAWFEPSYVYLEPDAQQPLERRRGNGFRLMIDDAAPGADLGADVVHGLPDIPPAADDATFAVYRRLFDYDPVPLDAKLEGRDDSHANWVRERVSFSAAYGRERVPAILFIPKNARPPYQTVVFYPGSDAVLARSSRNLWLRLVDFYVRSGRVVVYPVYRGTYERRVPAPRGPVERRDLRVQRVKDVRRVVDYLETRRDIDSKRLLFYGLSLGVSQAPFALAVEPRFKAAVLYAGGLSRSPALPEMQPQHYLPRVTLPVLLVTGRHDFQNPYETAQKPFFDLLGTPPQDKRHVVLDGGHLPPQYAETVREMLGWTDRWLGPVR